MKHALRTALIPMATFFAYQFALLFVGATFTETHLRLARDGRVLRRRRSRRTTSTRSPAVTLFVAVLVLLRRLPVGHRLRRARPASTGVADVAERASSQLQPEQTARRRTGRDRGRLANTPRRAPLPSASSCRGRRRVSRAAIRGRLPRSVRHAVAIQPARLRTHSCRRRRPCTGSAPRRRASTCSRSRCAACRSRLIVGLIGAADVDRARSDSRRVRRLLRRRC